MATLKDGILMIHTNPLSPESRLRLEALAESQLGLPSQKVAAMSDFELMRLLPD